MNTQMIISDYNESLKRTNPTLFPFFNCGLSEEKVIKKLSKFRAFGNLDFIYSLYQWHNGLDFSKNLDELPFGMFVGPKYWFIEIDYLIGHLGHLQESAKVNKRLIEGTCRYMPFFWNGNTRYFSADIQSGKNGRIVHVDLDSEFPFIEAYPNSDLFFKALIASNTELKVLDIFITSGHQGVRVH